MDFWWEKKGHARMRFSKEERVLRCLVSPASCFQLGNMARCFTFNAGTSGLNGMWSFAKSHMPLADVIVSIAIDVVLFGYRTIQVR